MAIILNDNLKILVGAPIDDKYLNVDNQPYSSISAVTNTIGIAQRYVGLTVNIVNEEYWFKNGVADGQLIEKISSSGGTGIVGIQNIGTGTGEIYSGLSGNTAELRTIRGSGDTTVTTNGAEILIFSETTGVTETIYTGASPSNINAGGMISGTTLTGRTLTEIIEDIARTTYFPVLVNPNSTFNDDQVATKEVGITLGSINFTSNFDRGLITPPYGTSGFRSGSANAYNYTGTDLPVLPVVSTASTNMQSINNYEVLLGTNTWTSSVDYDAGDQPKDSDGNNFNTPLPAGTTGAASNTITGIYPWFYGTVGGGVRPTPNQALIDSGNGNKQITSSNGTISVGNFNAIGEWIWFAIPNTSTSKTKWEGSNSPSNNGVIGGAVSGGGNLFPDPDVVSISSPDFPSINWNGINYKIYISNFPTSTYDSGSPYTLTFKNS